MSETIINFPPFGIVKLLFQVKRLLKLDILPCETTCVSETFRWCSSFTSYISITTTLKGAKQIPIGKKGVCK